MLLSAIDPALLIYQQEHWQTKQSHFFSRIETLFMHRRIVRRYDLQIAMSVKLAALVQQFFPWNEDCKTVGELRDLRQLLLEELNRAYYVEGTREADEITLEPDNLTCEHIEALSVMDAWRQLLCACAEQEESSGFDVQVATWECPVNLSSAQSVTVSVNDGINEENHLLPLVWDEDSWANRMISGDSWPDLRRCVEHYFLGNLGMQSHPNLRPNPIEFEWTDAFWKSVEDFCQPRMRQLLVKAISKKVYGLLDAKLGDESLGTFRRFRVTRFWRVHYREFGDRIVLEQFGEHNMGL